MSFPLQFRILGRLEVTQHGTPIQLGGRQQQALLARLLLDANQTVSVDRIVDGLWGEAAPASAVKMVHIHVSQLRKALGPELLLTRSPGYLLQVPPEAIDAERFEALRERGVRALQAGDAWQAAEDLAAALALWHGTPLDGFTEDFALAEAARLEELRVLALEDRIEAELALGRHSGLVPELEALAAQHPLRERFRLQLMLALYGCGRHADALEAYRTHRERLDEELGLTPSPALVELEQRILSHDPALEVAAAEPPHDPAPPGAAAAPAHSKGERRRIAVLVCNLRSADDPEELAEGVVRFAAIAERHGGSVARPFGTRAAAYFNYPRVYEDATARAVRAGLEAVAAVGLRAAVESGRAVVGGDGSGEVVGQVISEAAALADTAAEGTVAVGAAAAALVGPTIDLLREADAQYVAAGSSELVHRPTSGAASAIVGREVERALLIDRWRRAVAGTGQVVVVSGEAGIGKSRLCEELIASLEGEYATFSLRCARERAGSPYFPLANELGRCLGASSPSADMSDLETAAAVFGMTASDAVPVLTGLLGTRADGETDAAPEVARRQTLAALSAWFPAVAQSLPTLVIAEDLQWADPSTLEFLGMLVDEASRSRLLIVATSRPEFRTPWLGRSHVAAIALDRLTPAEVAALVDVQAGTALSDADRAAVVARSDGVPLFAEELARAVRAGETAELPEALEDVLVMRLDRLGGARDLALIGAVLGREFSFADVERLSGWSAEALDEALDVLVDQEVLHQRGQPPFAEYVFRHALVRDAAYATLLAADRRDLHARAATALKDVAPPELIAQHLSESGADAEAVEMWLAAARAAVAGSAFAEAREHARTALGAVERLPPGAAREEQHGRALRVLESAEPAAR